jgi:hypothetical protein
MSKNPLGGLLRKPALAGIADDHGNGGHVVLDASCLFAGRLERLVVDPSFQ